MERGSVEGDAAPLGGRDVELTALGRALVSGEPVLVVGAAGMGKTTVVQAAAHRVGRPLARGASLHFLESKPLLGLTRALGVAVEAGDLARVATTVADLLGERTLFLDDLQWADADTIAVLPLLAAHVPLVGAVRPGEGAFDAVVGALDGLALRLDLGPLDGAAAAGVIRHWRPAAAPGEVDQLLTVTGGNPLLLKLAALRHSRVAEAPVAAVVASCSDAARLALARLAIAPGSVPVDAAGVAELERRSLAHVDGRGTVRLAGDLLGEQALAALPPDVRRRLHTERATVTDDLGEASVHWRLAGDDQAAFAASLAAADQAASPLARALHLTAAFDLAPAERTWDLARQACDAWSTPPSPGVSVRCSIWSATGSPPARSPRSWGSAPPPWTPTSARRCERWTPAPGWKPPYASSGCERGPAATGRRRPSAATASPASTLEPTPRV